MSDPAKDKKENGSFLKILKELIKGDYAILLVGAGCILALILAMYFA